jgi:hypothetical protein
MFKRNPIEQKLDDEILHMLELMNNMTGYSEEYDKMASHVSKLMEARNKAAVSKDTWVTVGTHLAGLIILMNHERTHVIASKAFSFVKKIV